MKEVKKFDWMGWPLKISIAVFSLLFIYAIARIDFATQYRTAVSLMYIVAIVIAAYLSWRWFAVVMAILAGISDSLMTLFSSRPYQNIETLNSAIQGIFFVIFAYVLLALKESQARLKEAAITDPLTEVANSRYFSDIGRIESERSFRYRRPFTLVYLDVDNFKLVNDSMGHKAGDELLRDIAMKVRERIRRTDVMARLGGDEFAILLPETDAKGARLAVRRIQHSLSHVKQPKCCGALTFSIGVVTNTGEPCKFDEIISAADSLMYKAKHGGKNSVREGIFKR